MESSMVVREATTEDAVCISGLLTALAEEFIVGEFSEEGRRHFLAHFSVEEMAGRLASTNYRFQVAEIRGTLVGVVAVRERSHLQYLFVSKACQRTGVARCLWEQACQQAGNASGRFTVNASSYAVPAYRRLGFSPIGAVQETSGVRFQPMEWVWESSIS
jgi:ribosomal protein S18 acetylase RimI-like enzyme